MHCFKQCTFSNCDNSMITIVAHTLKYKFCREINWKENWCIFINNLFDIMRKLQQNKTKLYIGCANISQLFSVNNKYDDIGAIPIGKGQY